MNQYQEILKDSFYFELINEVYQDIHALNRKEPIYKLINNDGQFYINMEPPLLIDSNMIKEVPVYDKLLLELLDTILVYDRYRNPTGVFKYYNVKINNKPIKKINHSFYNILLFSDSRK